MTTTVTKPTRQQIADQIAEERREIVELCSKLRPEEWNLPSLCEGWEVRDVVAHVIGVQDGLMKIAMGGGPDRANIRLVKESRNLPTSTLLSQLVSIIEPSLMIKLVAMHFLEDTWVHHRDIAWALSAERQEPANPERVRMLLDGPITKWTKRYPGLKFVASDSDWQAGEGLEVKGTGEAIIMGFFHRPAAFERLTGDGLGRFKNKN